MSTTLPLYKNASARELEVFWSFVVAYLSYDRLTTLLDAAGSDGMVTHFLKSYAYSLSLYRGEAKEGDTFNIRDSNQLYRLKRLNPKNHMPPLCIILDNRKGSARPFRAGTNSKKDSFVRIQLLQRLEPEFLQYLQTRYTTACTQILRFLQDYLAFLSTSWKGALSQKERRRYFETSLRPRWGAKVDRENIFLLFRVFKQLRKAMVAHQSLKDRSLSLIVGLNQCPMPVFFWNCDRDYRFEFVFHTVELPIFALGSDTSILDYYDGAYFTYLNHVLG